MRLKVLLSLAALSVGILPTAASAQFYWGPDQIPNCPLESSLAECRATNLELLLERLDQPTAESLAAEGLRGVRLFQYDAFGTIWPAAIMLAEPGETRREGTVQAVIMQADGHRALLQRSGWESGWEEMDAVIEAILATPPVETIPPPISADGALRPPTCLHPPGLIIEVIAEGAVHRWWPAGCQRNAGAVEAYKIPQLIAAAFPACGHFDIARYGRGLGRLRACLSVDGADPIAAVEVLQILRPDISGDSQVVYDAENQADDVRLRGLDGREAAGRENVVAALMSGALGSRWLRVVRATGEGDGVTVFAQLRKVGGGDPDPLPLSLRWTKQADGRWRISDWSVEQP